MQLKLITIDFWNTLFTTDANCFRNSARLKVLLQTLNDIGVSFTEQQFDSILHDSWQYYNDKWTNETRTPPADEILNFIWNALNLPPNPKALDYIIDFFEKSILYFPPSLEPNALGAIQELSKKYILGIVSDTGFSPGANMTQMMEEIGVAQYFSGYSYSDETGVAKPHPKAFSTLLEKFNIKPHEALHIGDIEHTDITGAKDLGMHAIRYDGNIESVVVHLKTLETRADVILYEWTDILDYLK